MLGRDPCVQHIFHPPLDMNAWPSDDRRTRIVFITRDIDEATLRSTLGLFTEDVPASEGRSKPDGLIQAVRDYQVGRIEQIRQAVERDLLRTDP